MPPRLKKNIGNADRLLRTMVGIVLLTLADLRVIPTGAWGWAAPGLALVLFAEAYLAY